MSEQRDELQGFIDRHAIDELDDFHGSATCSCGMEMDESEHPAHVTDELLAAGYRKPRTITTVEELDVLAVGSVVLSDGYRYSLAYPNYKVSFQRVYDGEWHRGCRASSTHPDNIVPATVLYEPTPGGVE